MWAYPAKASAMVLLVFLTALDVWGEIRPAAMSYSGIRGSSYWGRPVRGRDMCLDHKTDRHYSQATRLIFARIPDTVIQQRAHMFMLCCRGTGLTLTNCMNAER